ncbi:MAG: hypothetical protein JSS10_07500 [Verrucomicrobia bacterium]|nr:hypothetical protein [Verrucomicrobiota bacterium]
MTITFRFTKDTSSEGFKLSGRTPQDNPAAEAFTGLFIKLMKMKEEAAQKFTKCPKFKVTLSAGNTTSLVVSGKSEGVRFSISIHKLSSETLTSLRPFLQDRQPSTPAPPPTAAAKPSLTEPIARASKLPPGIYNPNTNCFMNATFQMVMNDTELRRALLDTFRVEQGKCQAEIAKVDGTINTLNQQIAEIQTQYPYLYWLNAGYKAKNETLQNENNSQKNLQKLSTAYEAFFKAVEIYENGGKETIDLTPLRHLLTIFPGSGSSGQCDAEEFFNALFYKVKLSGYKIGYEEAFERTYAPLDPHSQLAQETYTREKWSTIQKEDLIQLQPGNKRKNPNGTNITLTLALEDAIKRANELNEAKKVKEVIKISGQELLDTLFMPCNVKDPASPTACTDGYYVMQTEKKTFEKPPQRFLVHLKRFTFEGAPKKISELVSMPELITIENKPYRVKAIIYHLGGASGGHYKAFLKKDHIWIEANDASVTVAGKSDVDEAKDNGYLYLYEEWEHKVEEID